MKPLLISHPPSLSFAEIFGIISAAVQQDTPVVLQALPAVGVSASPQVAAFIGLGELGLEIGTQIASAIQTAHAAKTAAGTTGTLVQP